MDKRVVCFLPEETLQAAPADAELGSGLGPVIQRSRLAGRRRTACGGCQLPHSVAGSDRPPWPHGPVPGEAQASNTYMPCGPGGPNPMGGYSLLQLCGGSNVKTPCQAGVTAAVPSMCSSTPSHLCILRISKHSV